MSRRKRIAARHYKQTMKLRVPPHEPRGLVEVGRVAGLGSVQSPFLLLGHHLLQSRTESGEQPLLGETGVVLELGGGQGGEHGGGLHYVQTLATCSQSVSQSVIQ